MRRAPAPAAGRSAAGRRRRGSGGASRWFFRFRLRRGSVAAWGGLLSGRFLGGAGGKRPAGPPGFARRRRPPAAETAPEGRFALRAAACGFRRACGGAAAAVQYLSKMIVPQVRQRGQDPCAKNTNKFSSNAPPAEKGKSARPLSCRGQADGIGHAYANS